MATPPPAPDDVSRLYSCFCRLRPMFPAAEHIQDPEGVVGPHGSADAITHGGAMSASVG